MIEWLACLSPAYPLILGGLAIALLRGAWQDLVFLAAPLVSLALVWLVPDGTGAAVQWLGLVLHPLASDWIARLFGTAFAIAAFFGAFYALDRRNTSERAAALVYAGAALGVVFAGDLLTLFVYWEVMAIGSTLVVLAGGAERAGLRYAWMHVFGGVLFLGGLTIVAAEPEGLSLRALHADSIGGWLLLAGILVNAGAPPVSAWVADAYPRASWAGAVFLSAFTTKAAVAVLIRLFPGEPALVAIGLVMAVYGLVYALIENDIRRMLSYSIVGQVGFMVVAIGIGSPLALAAAAAHAFSHIFYKSLLMMAAGSLLRATGTCRLTELGGLARRMPVPAFAAIIGGLSLAAMPLTAGFVSKSAIMAALADAHVPLPWFLLTGISAGSMLYAGLKLPWFAFFGSGSSEKRSSLPRSMEAAMIAMALLSLVGGIFPGILAELAPPVKTVRALTPDHVLFQLQLLGGAAVCFIMFLRLLSPVQRVTIDFDWLWREVPARAIASATRWRAKVVARWRPLTTALSSRYGRILPIWAVRLLESGNWRTGDIALAATALLGIALLISAL